MIYAGLTNVCNVWRNRQGITSSKKVFEDDPVFSDLDCNIQPTADVAVISALGSSASEAYVGYFPEDADVMVGDGIVQTDIEPDLFFKVESVSKNPGIGLGITHNVVAVLKRTKVAF